MADNEKLTVLQECFNDATSILTREAMSTRIVAPDRIEILIADEAGEPEPVLDLVYVEQNTHGHLLKACRFVEDDSRIAGVAITEHLFYADGYILSALLTA